MERKIYKPLVCEDGFGMSIQASEGNYCTPRNNVGPYVSVEVGYPTEVDNLLLPYAEDPSNPTSTVYGWVPSDIILEVITKRGGIKEGEMPPLHYASWNGTAPE